MEIYYITPRDNDFEEIYAVDNKFFSTYDKANAFLMKTNNEEEARWEKNQELHREKWQLVELAYISMEKSNLNPEKVFPYHHREYSFYDFEEPYVLKSIEVD